MLQTSSGGIALDESVPSLFSEVAKIVRDEIDLLELSSRCRVNPTTVRKILEERRISPYTEKKIRAGLELAPPPAGISGRLSKVERLREIHRLYLEKGTLEAVGRTIGLSRERVRQLLVRGVRIGLFEYSARRISDPSREKILEDYRKFLGLEGVAEVNRLSIATLRRLCRSYRITREELAAVRDDRRRTACIDLYFSLARELGHPPTPAELERLKKGRSLQWQIRKKWGSFDAFRRDLKIPSP